MKRNIYKINALKPLCNNTAHFKVMCSIFRNNYTLRKATDHNGFGQYP